MQCLSMVKVVSWLLVGWFVRFVSVLLCCLLLQLALVHIDPLRQPALFPSYSAGGVKSTKHTIPKCHQTVGDNSAIRQAIRNSRDPKVDKLFSY